MPKWSVDAVDKDLAGVDPDSIDSMYDPAIGLPPKGPYLCAVKFIKVGVTGQNSNAPGSAKIWLKAEISEPPGTKKAKFNGYELHKHQNVALASEAGRVNQILLALLDNTKLPASKRKAILEAFHARNVVVDDKDNITKIGTWTLPEGMKIGIVTRPDTDQNGDKSLGVGSFMPASQAPKGIAEDADDEDEVDEDETAEEEEVDDEDEEVTARQEELEGYTLAKLKTLAKSLDITIKRGVKEPELIDAILDVEFPVEESEEDEDAEEPEEDDTETDEDEEEEPEEEDEDDEEGDDLDDLSRAELKKILKEEEVNLRVTTKTSDDAIREAIRNQRAAEEEDDEEEDEEPEPEPAPKPRRKGASPAPKGRAAEKRRGGQAAADDEPPF